MSNKDATIQYGENIEVLFSEYRDDWCMPETKARQLCQKHSDEWMGCIADKCESEIERLFAANLAFIRCGFLDHPPVFWDAADPLGMPSNELVVSAQFNVGRFRPDFVIWLRHPSAPEIKMVVECDGHAWHDKTPQQAARDKSRDRFLISNGWRVMRFTGSEIVRDAQGCADEVSDVLSDLLEDAFVAGGNIVETRQSRLSEMRVRTGEVPLQ